MPLKITQFRVARPTDQLPKLISFYKDGLGFEELGRFEDHEGFSGIMPGCPGESWHLEFTEHRDGSPCPAPTKDNLLVFYFENRGERDWIAQRLFNLGFLEVEPENPCWKMKGITIEDPDKWRVVLMEIKRFDI